MRRVRILKDFDVTTNPSARPTQKVWRSYKAGPETVEVLESQYDQLLAEGKIEDAPAESGDDGKQKETAGARRKPS